MGFSNGSRLFFKHRSRTKIAISVMLSPELRQFRLILGFTRGVDRGSSSRFEEFSQGCSEITRGCSGHRHTRPWSERDSEEFRANEGKVGETYEGAPLLLLIITGTKMGREHPAVSALPGAPRKLPQNRKIVLVWSPLSMLSWL